MPSNLPSTINLGEVGACLFRVARLDSNCAPLGGDGSGYVTAGIVDGTATPDIEEGTTVAPKTGCDVVGYRIVRDNRLNGFTIAGNLLFWDDEGMFQMFGGSVITGRAGGPFAGDTIGWAAPNYDAPASPGVYLEMISQNVAEGAGDCITSGDGFPTYVGHIFGKVKLNIGEISLTNDAILLPFSGTASSNPNLANGPWNDFPGQGYIPNSPYVKVGYSTEEYEAILADVAAGQADLPAGSG